MQAIGNLCVLQHYDVTSAACGLYRDLQARSSTASVAVSSANSGASISTFGTNQEWRARLPGLFYPDRGVSALSEASPELPANIALPPAIGSRLRYVLASYSLNGTYLGLSELSDQLQLCAGGAHNPTAFLDFGTSMRLTCNVPPATLFKTVEPVFHDLYVYFDTRGDTGSLSLRLEDIASGFLYPVPVAVRNLRIDGQYVNRNLQTFDDQLTRRFFIVDAATGVKVAGQLPRVVRYLKSVRLTATLRSDSFDGPVTSNRMLPPLLEVDYGEVAIPLSASSPLAAEAALATEHVTLPTSFEARYTMQFSSSHETINYFFVITLVVWVLVTVVNSATLLRRNAASAVDGYMMLRLLAQASAVFASAFFALLFCLSLWWTFLFKGQSELYFMMPLQTAQYLQLGLMPFEVMLTACFSAKLLHMLDVLNIQTQHDIFFVDWEQPRAVTNEAHDETDEATASPYSKSLSGTHSGSQAKGNAQPVSVWRTVFVANEWVKLQGMRTISCEINLLGLLFFLKGLGLEQSATLIPAGQGQPGVPPHVLLRFAISSALLLAIALAQYIFRWTFWERFVKDRVWQFVDLLAVTNVSCLLLEERHFGFYLHGRSVHDHADADMLQLNANLKREEEGLEMLRGFRQDSRVQTFEIYLSPKVRQAYDRAFAGLLDSPHSRGSTYPSARRSALGEASSSGNTRRRGFRAAPEEGVTRHKDLNHFLVNFLGTPSASRGDDAVASVEGGQPEVRKRTYWEQLLGMPPEMGYQPDKSVFLEDTTGRFKRLLLAGREYDVVLLSVLTYGLVDMTAANT